MSLSISCQRSLLLVKLCYRHQIDCRKHQSFLYISFLPNVEVISRDRLFILNIFRRGLDVEHPDQRAERVAAALKSIKKALRC